MERMKAIKQNRKLHKKFCRAMGYFLITLVLLCAAGGNLFAKYYAGQKNKGVGVASSLYFSSNVLKQVTNEASYPAIYNKDSWTGESACNIKVDICNYANQLLYNDANLDITYEISFSLKDNKSDDGIYQVNFGDKTDTIKVDNPVTISGLTLKGGKQNQDEFTISVTRPDTQSSNLQYRSVGIVVTATPVSPSYVANSAKLGGVIYASMISAAYDLSYSFNLDANATVSDYSGFPCTIAYIPGEDQAAHEMKISWRKDLLEIDNFNSYYQQVKPYGEETSTDGTNWRYIIITIPPYSSIEITFYRTSTMFKDNEAQLTEYVKVYDNTAKQAGKPGGSGNL